MLVRINSTMKTTKTLIGLSLIIAGCITAHTTDEKQPTRRGLRYRSSSTGMENSSTSGKPWSTKAEDPSGYWEITDFWRIKYGDSEPQDMINALTQPGEVCHKVVSLDQGYYSYKVTYNGNTFQTHMVTTPDKNVFLGTNVLGALTFWMADNGNTMKIVAQVPGSDGFLIKGSWHRVSKEEHLECLLNPA